MSGQNYIVPPLSWGRIGGITDQLRVQFSLSSKPFFPVMEFIERVLDQRLRLTTFFTFGRHEMDGAEGLTHPAGDFIALREDVYQEACEGGGRARFTAAHELGHFVLHVGTPLARAPDRINVPPYKLSEQQANQFAAEILMPRVFAERDDTVHTIAERHGVSREAAQRRLEYFIKEGVI